MSKIILNLAMSLDGFIEGPEGQFDWCFSDQDYGMTDFLESIDVILFGRISYDVLLSMDKNAFPDKKKIIISKSYSSTAEDTLVIPELNQASLEQIRQASTKNIWLFGGAQLFCSMLQFQMVDELLVAIHPVLLGEGKSLASRLNKRINLELLNSIPYSSGLLQAHYKVLYT